MQYLSVVLPAAVRRAGTQQPSLLLFFFFFLFYTETGNTHSTLCFSACHRGLLTTLTQLRPHGAQTDQNRLQKALRVMPSLEKHYYHRHIIKKYRGIPVCVFPCQLSLGVYDVHYIQFRCSWWSFTPRSEGPSLQSSKSQLTDATQMNFCLFSKFLWILCLSPGF